MSHPSRIPPVLNVHLSTKDVQQQFTKAIFKKKFRAEHSKELDAYAESVKYFREENDGKLPSLKSLKKRKEELTKEIAERKKAYCGRLQTGQGHEE